MIIMASQLSRIIIASVLALAPSLQSQADPRTTPTASYRAELLLKAQGMADMTAPIAYSGGQLRLESSKRGEPVWFIFRRGSREVTAIRPGRREYETIVLPDGYDPFTLLGVVAPGASRLGEETAAGERTTKWNVSGALPQGGTISASVWTTRDNIQVKAEGETMQEGAAVRFSGELRNLRVGAVDATLFQIPAGFTRKATASPPRADATELLRPAVP